MKRVVFDTNILISGKHWKGNPFRCLEVARHGIVDGFTCDEILKEFSRVSRKKLEHADDEVLSDVAELLTFLRLVRITGDLKFVQEDSDDDKILECAVVAKATHIVTGDTKHLLPPLNS